jgi:hypothetical protein
LRFPRGSQRKDSCHSPQVVTIKWEVAIPWTAASAKRHTKEADTPAKQAAWAKAANAALKKYRNEGRAIRVANAAVANMKSDGETEDAFRKRRRKVQQYDPRGREVGTYEEEWDSRQLELPLAIIVDTAPVANSLACMVYDAIELDADPNSPYALKPTEDGYMKAMPRIARTGIQLYKGDECGRADMDVVRVYRPESSVFANDATHSYTHLPITIEHPGGTVDSTNWRKHAVGETGDEVLRDGHTVRVPLMLRDAEAIQLVREGKRELSVGYGCDLAWGEGITPDGEVYDAVQHNIRGNHLAIVSHARGGSTLRIGDTKMSDQKTVLIDGLPCQMSDKDAAIVQRTIAQLQDQVENFKKKFAKKEEEEEEAKDAATDAIAKAATEIATRDGKITALEQQLKDAQLTSEKLDVMVDQRLVLRDQARKLLPTFKHDGKSDADIRRAVVAAKLGDERAKAMSDENIVGAFQAYVAAATPTSDPIKDAAAAFSGGDAGQNPKAVAYAEMVRDMENAWRKPA